MKILHLNAGNETGGGMHHILLLLNELNREEFILGLFEEGEFFERAIALGIETVIFEQNSRLDLSVIKKVASYIIDNDVTILHTHGARANLFGGRISSKANCQWVTTIHSDPRDDFLGQGLKGKVFTKLNMNSIKKADHLFAISDTFKKMLLSFNIKEAKITTIYNGIDFSEKTSQVYTRESLGLKDSDFVILMVARLEKVKNHPTAFNALKQALKVQPAIKLILVGDGVEKEHLVGVRNQLQLQSNIFFLNHRNDVIDLYPLADIGILTSKSESFPLVLLEAARANLPVITTDVGGVQKMIKSKEYGWINEIGDAEGLAESILEAIDLKEKGELPVIGKMFGEYCRENFSIKNQADSIYDSYLRLTK